MQENKIIQALVSVQNWGSNAKLVFELVSNPHIISLYHTMGDASFILDTNFDNKLQLETFIEDLKTINHSGTPAIRKITTEKIIDVLKQKRNFTLENYREPAELYHFFTYADVVGSEKKFVSYCNNCDIIHSLLHIQSNHSFVIEIIAPTYRDFRNLISEIRSVKNVTHLVSQEVISVKKYRNRVMRDSGVIELAHEDTRELYSL